MTEEDDPLADLDVGGSGDRNGDPFEEDLFSEEETGTVDEEAVWAELEAADAEGTAREPEQSVADGAAGTDETVVKKRSYCERCEYLSEPPEVSCTHPNTEIVELVDTERFRVRNCPVVARRQNRDIERIAGGEADSERSADDADAGTDTGE